MSLEQSCSALEADRCRFVSSDPTFTSTILDAYSQHPHLKQQSAYQRQVYILSSFYCTGVC
ncbi:hypothetical protein YC2023_105798 [Brassica napus]